jgi:hypothetical protein
MIPWILRRTPNARDTKFSAPAFRIVVRAVDFAPRMAATDIDSPSTVFSMAKRLFNLLLRMSRSTHFDSPQGYCHPPWLSTDNHDLATPTETPNSISLSRLEKIEENSTFT